MWHSLTENASDTLRLRLERLGELLVSTFQ